jgi:tRNA(Ile)-lysidine synthase
LAFSGGLDSTVLLHTLTRAREHLGFTLSAIHVDHGLQADSGKWAEHCQRVCAQWNVPCRSERVKVARNDRRGVEAAAREARYESLRDHVSAGELLLTAQHEDDQAETLLLQLLRGTGVHGLAGMRLVSPFGAGLLARPLLGFARSSLEAYARAEDLSWVEDASNRDASYSRNFLRHVVLPAIADHWPTAPALLARAAANARDAAALLDEVGRGDLAVAAHDHGTLSIAYVQAMSPSRARNLLRYWLRAHGWPAPSALHLEQVQALAAHRPRTQHAVVTWPGVEVHRYRDLLYARHRLPKSVSVDVSWDGAAPLVLPGLGCRLIATVRTGRGLARHWFEAGAVRVRLREGGESCRPARRGHRHKVKKLLQEADMPPWRRQHLPLLYVGEDISAVPDVCACEPYAAKPDEEGLWVEISELEAASENQKVIE